MCGGVVKLITMLSLAAVSVPHATAQSVISARSGLVHYFEGNVYVAGQRLEAHLGRFPVIAEGAEIRTEQGRAEILLNPGVIMRIGENAGVRMIDNDIEHTRLELLRGSAAIDCTQTGPGPALTLLFDKWNVHFLAKGLYRIDSDPAVIQVRTGRAEVASDDQQPVSLERGASLPLQAVLAPQPPSLEHEDALSDWAIGRRQSIMADDAISSQIDQDPAAAGDLLAGMPGVSYFPLIGLSSGAPAYGGYYDPYSTRQGGFNSIYLPGYYYRPLIYVGGGGYWGLHSGPSPSGLLGSTRTVLSPGSRMIHFPNPVAPPPRLATHSGLSSSHATVSHPIGHVGIGHVGRGR